MSNSRPARWSAVPLLLVVVLLLGSVLIPARQTWRIMHLLRETTEVIEPARLLVDRLEFGLTVESAALEHYATSPDSVHRTRYIAALDDNRRLAAIEDLARMLDAEAIDRTVAIRNRVSAWRDICRTIIEDVLSPAQLTTAMQSQQASYWATLQDVTSLASYLAAEANARRDLIRRSERLSLLVNAALVLIALAAVFAVTALRQRERRLTRILQRRLKEEAALRHVAKTLGDATTTSDVMRRIAEGATAITHIPNAYLECMARDDGTAVDFVSIEDGRSPSPCSRKPRSGSLVETMSHDTGSLTERDVDSVGTASAASDLAPRDGLFAPLSSSEGVFGVLALFRDRSSAGFGEDTRRQMLTIADLASAALQRVAVQMTERRALEEAERRARQEAALREAAEALAAAFTVDEVTQQIARTALIATEARGAFVEQIVSGSSGPATELTVRATAGSNVPPLGSGLLYAASCAEHVLTGGEPVLIPDLARAEHQCAASLLTDPDCSAIVVPLGHAGAPIGALFVLSATLTPFRPDDLARAHTFGHLAALAYEKVRLLDEARNGRQQLERVIKSRSRLMRGFSHDVKNPLGAADGYAELLTAGIYGDLSDEQRESVTRIRRSLHSALDLIEDLHEMARAETGNISLSMKLVDLADLVRASGDEYRAAAEASGLSLFVDVGSVPIMIETDRVRVRQIISNLLSNAIKYTAQGSVELRARQELAEEDGSSDRWAVIDVSDTGRGIASEKWDAIFEEFVRLGASEKSGAGLGLAVSQRLAQALGGLITVHSEVGRGSTFTLRLPVHKIPSSGSSAATPPPSHTMTKELFRTLAALQA